MNLFLIGWRPSGGADPRVAETHLRGLVARLPPPRLVAFERWVAPSGRLVMTCAAHESDRVGGIRYAHLERDRLAVFSGRPFRDSLGAYPLFSGQAGGTRWISNSAELVRRVLGTRDLDLSAVAGLVGAGWSLSGEPVWARVRRIPPGVALALRADRPDTETRQLPLEEIAGMAGGGFDPEQTARLLVAGIGALADWPGRPVVLQLSGGCDSRLLLAAAIACGIDVEVVSTGEPDLPDVGIARQLCAAVDVKHQLRPRDPGAALYVGLPDTARFLSLTSGGAISLEDAAGYFTATDGAMRLLLNGQGGEIARAYYGNGDGLGRDELVRKLFDLVATSADLLSPRGRDSS